MGRKTNELNEWWKQNKTEYKFSRKVKKIDFKLSQDQRKITVAQFSTQNPTESLKVITLIPNVDMRYSHNGLCYVAQRKGINPDKIPPGNFVVFVNSNWTMCKVLTTGRIIVSAQAPSGKLHWSYIENLPKAFGANGSFDFSKAIKAGLLKTLEKQKEERRGLARFVENFRETAF